MRSAKAPARGFAADGSLGVVSPRSTSRELVTTLLLTSGSLPLPTEPAVG